MSNRLVSALENVRQLPEITLGRIIDQVQEEALLIVCVVAILPFMQPIPLPGISSILGIIVLFQGIGLIYGKPLLTKKMKEFTISRDRFEMILRAATKFDNPGDWSAIVESMSAHETKDPKDVSKWNRVGAGLSYFHSSVRLSDSL